jgi:hypothetical protein
MHRTYTGEKEKCFTESGKAHITKILRTGKRIIDILAGGAGKRGRPQPAESPLLFFEKQMTITVCRYCGIHEKDPCCSLEATYSHICEGCLETYQAEGIEALERRLVGNMAEMKKPRMAKSAASAQIARSGR